MVLASMIRNRAREEGRREYQAAYEKGRSAGLQEAQHDAYSAGHADGRRVGWQEGRDAIHRVWSDWSERRERAWINALIFDEPPPSPNSVSRYQAGLKDGSDRMFRLWQHWNERPLQAEWDGTAFDESPPSPYPVQ